MKTVPSALPRLRPLVFLAACAALVWSPALPGAEPALELKANDLWVMAGDSITAQRQHTNFIEAYYQTRFPGLHLRFRNSGIGGNRISHVLKRFDADIAAFKPAIVSVELGMNDVNGSEEPGAYLEGIREIVAKIRALPAQPVLISSSPVDDGSMLGDWRSERCRRLHAFTEALQKFAAQESVVFIDQYHPLINLWGENRRKGIALAEKNGTWPPPAHPEHGADRPPGSPGSAGSPRNEPPLGAHAPRGPGDRPQDFRPGQNPQNPQNPPRPLSMPLPPGLVNLGGDPVHPGPVGQYQMAAVILRGLKAPGQVSAATLKADGSVVESTRCKITEVRAEAGRLAFTRLDESGPWPIHPEARATLDLMPSILELSGYFLKVTGLADGQYQVRIQDEPAAELSARELAAGWNMAAVFQGALAERSKTILGLIAKLQGKLNSEWREASSHNDAPRLAAAQSAIDAAETELHAAVAPVAWRFEIALLPK